MSQFCSISSTEAVGHALLNFSVCLPPCLRRRELSQKKKADSLQCLHHWSKAITKLIPVLFSACLSLLGYGWYSQSSHSITGHRWVGERNGSTYYLHSRKEKTACFHFPSSWVGGMKRNSPTLCPTIIGQRSIWRSGLICQEANHIQRKGSSEFYFKSCFKICCQIHWNLRF